MLIGVWRGDKTTQHPKNIESRLARQKNHPLAGRAQILPQNQLEASAIIPKRELVLGLIAVVIQCVTHHRSNKE